MNDKKHYLNSTCPSRSPHIITLNEKIGILISENREKKHRSLKTGTVPYWYYNIICTTLQQVTICRHGRVPVRVPVDSQVADGILTLDLDCRYPSVHHSVHDLRGH
jgi:hypothetical protein